MDMKKEQEASHHEWRRKSVREVSVETWTELNDEKATTAEKEEETLVPSRDVLNRTPFYSTPLVQDTTNAGNGSREFISNLVSMGFDSEKAECAVVMTNAQGVERAIDFIERHSTKQWHRFVLDWSNPDIATSHNISAHLCATCGKPHERGAKIVFSSNNDNLNSNDDNIIITAIEDNNEQKNAQLEHQEEKLLTQLIFDPVLDAPAPLIEGATQMCLICLEEKPKRLFFYAPCRHNYCRPCLEKHYKFTFTIYHHYLFLFFFYIL
ncbi:hypothetical protein RFI_11162 [Reticulomyxa filosa]|uniref:UBA domain-containing protein n=1 Tax=Reticulomyxa filosa TaxID=46433 RepID=X6NKT3_RETFI|nr:hypothetical protein RFI_11162 [Reticulomyxa filosa]|eukprot:ETO25977.1 hypothetical protein RFI_11162 [Reticulomyxa filosa]